KERKRADSIVVSGNGVKDECVGSNGSVLEASGVEQQRCGAHCCIGTAVVEDQRSTAYSRIETAVRIGKERIPTKRCISSTGCEGVKCVAAFRCGEVGVATVRRWTELPLRSG